MFKSLAKPNAVLLAEKSIQNIKETKKTLGNLGKQIKEIPGFILLILDQYQKLDNLDGIQFESEAPWVLAEEGNPVLTLFCPNTSIVRRFTWRHTDFFDWENLREFALKTRNI